MVDVLATLERQALEDGARPPKHFFGTRRLLLLLLFVDSRHGVSAGGGSSSGRLGVGGRHEELGDEDPTYPDERGALGEGGAVGLQELRRGGGGGGGHLGSRRRRVVVAGAGNG